MRSTGVSGAAATADRSVVGWLGLAVPIYFASRWAIDRYRATIGARVQQSKFYQAIMASKAYNIYRLFRPE